MAPRRTKTQEACRLALFIQQFEKECELEAKMENTLATVEKVFKVELMKMPPSLQNTLIGDLISGESSVIFVSLSVLHEQQLLFSLVEEEFLSCKPVIKCLRLFFFLFVFTLSNFSVRCCKTIETNLLKVIMFILNIKPCQYPSNETTTCSMLTTIL
uniref:Borealin N-terminal domain-containing protein n=1 Tax=Pundamilia nyererei TaxID=303518 RepID=A0A3B4EZY3_9CICH